MNSTWRRYRQHRTNLRLMQLWTMGVSDWQIDTALTQGRLSWLNWYWSGYWPAPQHGNLHEHALIQTTQVSPGAHSVWSGLKLQQWVNIFTSRCIISNDTHRVPQAVHLEPLQQLLADLHGTWQEGSVGQKEVLDVGGVNDRWLFHQVHDQTLRGSLESKKKINNMHTWG